MANTAKKLSDKSVEESAPMQVVKNEPPASSALEIPVEQPARQPELTLEQHLLGINDKFL